MTPEQIQAYFGTDVVYIFNGTTDDLQDLMVANYTSYNYIVDGVPSPIVAGESVAYLSVEPSRHGAETAHIGGASVEETQSDVEVEGAAPWSAAKLPPT